MIAFALSQKGLLNVSSSDSAFAAMVAQFLPVGFKGVVVCGLLAALMSSLASLFNSSAALFVGDFYKKFKPDSSERHLLVVGRIATAAVVVLGVVWIPVMLGLGKVLYDYLQAVQGLLAPAIATVFLLGVFWKRTTAKGALWGMILGFAIGMFRSGPQYYYRGKGGLVIIAEKLDPKWKLSLNIPGKWWSPISRISQRKSGKFCLPARGSLQSSVNEAAAAWMSFLRKAKNMPPLLNQVPDPSIRCLPISMASFST